MQKNDRIYTYPNGLKCGASEKRIKLFEVIIPPLALLLAIAGFLFIPPEIINEDTRILTRFFLSLLIGTAWTVFVALVFSIIFDIWCKPINDK